MTAKTILVVDDDRGVREVVAATLGQKDFLVLQAGNGREAIEIARATPPDLALLDVSMPEMDGLEVCRWLKANPSTAHTRVVMLTGKSSQDDLKLALAAGADSYFTKPFSPIALLSVVQKAQGFPEQGGVPAAGWEGPAIPGHPEDQPAPAPRFTHPLVEVGRTDEPVGAGEELSYTQLLTYARDVQALYRELVDRERRLHDAVGQILAAQEEERRRVAYEVHDGVAQVAASAHQHLQAFARRHRPRSPAAREALDRALELAQRTVGEARRVIANLRPTVLDDFGLETALRLEVEAMRSEGWQVELEVTPGAQRLPPAIETALFRVAQESLSNIRKHAGGTRVYVGLERKGRGICLEVRDWGRGFRPGDRAGGTGPGEHLGILGMQERISLLGGRCTVHSQPGAGTRVVAEVPVPTDAG